ncbi:FecR family protein [Sphingobacterium paucimobilis]|uniref:FecR protein domain-containing protein n=1 Tax=Sphingobacterium paucimobilis HER1398 TaxID=1346330 RepID=U2HTU3_9SPHI|nr:FecR family protein [Sphingobacterium paucimobilis]ERJ58937.1 hypothetical protein M472_09150 [Sphingobacterium paucimobilis HER1398]
MNNKKAAELIDKYLAGQCTAEEQTVLFAYFNTFLDKNHKLLSTDETDQLHRDTWERISNQIGKGREKTPIRSLNRSRLISITAAAAILIIAGFFIKKTRLYDSSNTITEDILPVGEGALLTLENGRTIELSATHTGIDFTKEYIAYQDGSALYPENTSRNSMYRLSTPKGSTYQLTLSDGTTVFLNGGSEIKYPRKFEGEKRKVEFEGEAYFSVKKHAKQPFIVVTKGQEIKVLGTVFNISTYTPMSTKTTLVEGSVLITADIKTTSPFLLSPGEQSIVRADGSYDKKKVDLKKELAWRSGLFYFDQTPFSEILQQVSQWYDVDITYSSGIPQGTFSGIINRNLSLQTLIEYFEDSSPHQFKIENRTLRVKAQK